MRIRLIQFVLLVVALLRSWLQHALADDEFRFMQVPAVAPSSLFQSDHVWLNPSKALTDRDPAISPLDSGWLSEDKFGVSLSRVADTSGKARFSTFRKPEPMPGLSRAHAGVLGRSYLDGQYIHLSAPDEVAEMLDAINGFRSTINVAVPWKSETAPLSQDIFVSYRYLQADGGFGGFGFDTSLSDLMIGTTLFTSVGSFVRPFLQVGYDQSQTSVEMTMGRFHFEDTDRDSALLLVAGTEIDLSADLALRLAADLDFDPFEDTILTAELVYWLGDHVFLRGGGLVTVEGEMPGFLIGGGIAL